MADTEPSAADLKQARPVRSLEGVDSSVFEADIESRYEPTVMRHIVRDWPAVRAARESAATLFEYLAAQDNGATVRAFVGEPEMAGRYFYGPGLKGFNFTVGETRVSELLSALAHPAEVDRPIYMGSTLTRSILPRFAAENPMRIADDRGGEARIWIGNRSRIAPHYDESDNMACVVSGRRRFILFPPEQVVNLYVGPIDNTVAGQPTSMVDLEQVDFERFPRFREALNHVLVADLEPGDAIYIPALWWHAVQADGPMNVLVNYWWDSTPPDAGSPMQALAHALLAISHLPEDRRRAWRSMFDHYVFRENGDPVAHIPVSARGIAGRSTPELRKSIRQSLVRALQKLGV